MTNNILRKWEENGNLFLRFLDGNRTNRAPENLEWVNIVDAMDNLYEWTTDWDMSLSRKERELVIDPLWRDSFITSSSSMKEL